MPLASSQIASVLVSEEYVGVTVQRQTDCKYLILLPRQHIRKLHFCLVYKL